jgi:hypothetical protein
LLYLREQSTVFTETWKHVSCFSSLFHGDSQQKQQLATSSLPLCFHHAATSSLPLTARPSPFTRVKPRSCPAPPGRAGAGHLEAARHPFFSYLSHRAPPPVLLLPPNAIATVSNSRSSSPSTLQHFQIPFAIEFASSQRIVQAC